MLPVEREGQYLMIAPNDPLPGTYRVRRTVLYGLPPLYCFSLGNCEKVKPAIKKVDIRRAENSTDFPLTFCGIHL